ncbi:hypothetical protein OCV73_01085 [Barnesiella propionica]|uniref:hypothetical protein n=1 Tax=Barnesiella propionica TaxID=2981781 RepID=UPI0011CAEBB8|nr:hypothetical protein [Barnesiella propionica]MCU6767555.1 hypothetical protein [Barnesiella propionica]
MKKMFRMVVLLFTVSVFAVSCSDDNKELGPAGNSFDLGDGSDAYEIKEDMKLTYPNTYNLKGFVYVTDGATLTIEPGVIIKGDKNSKATLIIERGGKLIAEGTKDKPIVFTSAQAPGNRKPGDWGGLILLGRANNNKGEQTIEGGVRSSHGGNNDNDDSGILKYVRCEFAGIEYSTDNEINGITFGSVGSGTVVDYVQVSYSGDDSFEWFGGTVNCRHLVALRTWDDDFDTDNGYSGKLQYLVALRDPQTGDKSASNGFESDNCADASAIEPYTSCVFSNVSMFGPVVNPSSYNNEAGVKGSKTDARFQAAMHLRRNTQLRVFNSLFAAFPIGLIIENDKKSTTQSFATSGKLVVENCVFAGMVKNYQDAQYWSANTQLNPDDNGTFASGYFNREGGKNKAFTSVNELRLKGDPFSLTSFNMIPASDSPLASGADWSNSYVSTGFDKVSYIGAFAPTETVSDNWMSGWTNMDPQNTIY